MSVNRLARPAVSPAAGWTASRLGSRGPFAEARRRYRALEVARAIAEAHVLSWQTAYGGIVPDPVLDALSLEQRADAWRGSLPSPDQDVWVAELDGRVVGFSNDGAAYGGPN